MLPLFGKLQVGKKPVIPLTRTSESDKSGAGKGSDAEAEVILVEPIREFPPPPPPPAAPVQKVEEASPSPVVQEEASQPDAEVQEPQESQPSFEQEASMLMPQYQGEAAQDLSQNTIMESFVPDMQQQPGQMHAYPGYPPPTLEEDGLEAEDGLAPLESQPDRKSVV